MMMVDIIQHALAASKKRMPLVHIPSDHIRACSPYFRAAGRRIRHRAGLLGHFAVSRVSIQRVSRRAAVFNVSAVIRVGRDSLINVKRRRVDTEVVVVMVVLVLTRVSPVHLRRLPHTHP